MWLDVLTCANRNCGHRDVAGSTTMLAKPGRVELPGNNWAGASAHHFGAGKSDKAPKSIFRVIARNPTASTSPERQRDQTRIPLAVGLG